MVKSRIFRSRYRGCAKSWSSAELLSSCFKSTLYRFVLRPTINRTRHFLSTPQTSNLGITQLGALRGHRLVYLNLVSIIQQQKPQGDHRLCHRHKAGNGIDPPKQGVVAGGSQNSRQRSIRRFRKTRLTKQKPRFTYFHSGTVRQYLSNLEVACIPYSICAAPNCYLNGRRECLGPERHQAGECHRI